MPTAPRRVSFASASFIASVTIVAVLDALPVATGAAGMQAPVASSAAASANCVALGSPKPTLNFSYTYADTTGSSEYTNRWDQLTPTGSRLITTRTGANAGQSTFVSKHAIVDDAIVLEASTSVGTDANGVFNNSMAYAPGAVGDPAGRACEGRTWTIAAVNATMKSSQGSFSIKTDPGTMTIITIHERMTVPAGTFDTVHYMKTMNSGRGQLVDEFWKSIEHGVTVKRNSRQPGSIGVETLVSIK